MSVSVIAFPAHDDRPIVPCQLASLRQAAPHNDRTPFVPIRVFISHSSVDEVLASALVDCILASVAVEEAEIRCTSVAGYRLPVGSDFAAVLKDDIGESSVVVGLLTQKAIASSWVLFELGASWGSGKHLLPLLSGEVNGKLLPGPLANRHAARLSDVNDLAQFLAELSSILRRPMHSPTKITRAIDALSKVHAAHVSEHRRATTEMTSSSAPEPFVSTGISREALRFGIALGWQLARYEVIHDAPFAEAKTIAPAIAADIGRALKRDGFPDDVADLGYQDLMQSVLSYYSATSIAKHAGILLGVASMRTTFIEVAKKDGNGGAMESLAYGALADADPSVLPNKDALFQELLRQKPGSIAGVLALLDGGASPHKPKT